jgi:hypothetical protein
LFFQQAIFGLVRDSPVNKGSGHIDTLGERLLAALFGCGSAVLRYSLCSFNLETLEQTLVDTAPRLKRRKALDAGHVQGRRVAALDGIEAVSSINRHSESCLQRRVTLKNAASGQSCERLQYYHRAVGLSDDPQPGEAFPGAGMAPPGRRAR